MVTNKRKELRMIEICQSPGTQLLKIERVENQKIWQKYKLHRVQDEAYYDRSAASDVRTDVPLLKLLQASFLTDWQYMLTNKELAFILAMARASPAQTSNQI